MFITVANFRISVNDLVKIKNALDDGKKVGGMRLMGRKTRFYNAYVENYTLMGNGWTMYFSAVLEKGEMVGAIGLQLIGKRDRFEEDFIQAKLTVS
jgi:hypothetical protein